MTEPLDALIQEHIREAQTFEGIPPTTRQVPFENMAELLERAPRTLADKTFLTYYGPQGAHSGYTYREFDERVNQTANFMQTELGIRRGDCIATIAGNHPDVLLIYFAAWKLGAVVAPQNVAEDDRHIAFVLDNSQAQVVFVHMAHLDRAKAILPQVTAGVPVGDAGRARG